MKSSRTLVALAVAALIPLSGAALAGDKDKMGSSGATFDALDANRDGRISQAEAAVDSTIVFTTADANGDGYLDKKEFKAASKGSQDSTSSPQSATQPQTDQGVPQDDPSSSTPQPDSETPRQ